MSIIEAIILGIVQGLTEFLPVSSSGHLQLAKALLGVEIEENLLFDCTLHAATVLSTIVILWPEIKRLVMGLFSRTFNDEQAYIIKLIISMIPIAIVGFTLKDYLNAMLSSPYILTIVGAMLLLTAVLLTFAYYARPRNKATISYRDATIIGVAQAVAAMPGLSRSGSTIATGIILGNEKSQVAQFSFLMVLAPILGEMLLNIAKGEVVFSSIGTAPLLVGFIASFVVGCLACKFMLGIVRRGKLVWFAVYCAIVGVISIICNFI
ncbi:MAG: undecaprenyl-diphosphate phosphatase [Rikenellaceae bacterium]|nr:undecaprenyl-diphosphate phosphatase [Rikenellaceae bacterium]